jgi:hypothetical protein
LSAYNEQPLDFANLKTISIHDRGGKVRVAEFASPYPPGAGLAKWMESLPRILAADTLRSVASAIAGGRGLGKALVWGLGGHVVKCGLAPVLIDLMDRGFITALAMNGAAAIHDFEIGLCGQTSEDVEMVLPDGRFGSAEETGREMNLALIDAASDGIGAGEAYGRRLAQLAPAQFASASLLVAAYRRRIPVTVHIAVGTDTPHTHPATNAAALGVATHQDFRLFSSILRGLDQGGVYLNVGSAVVLPEVFLKAVSVVRNLGYPLREFTTVNLDFLQHYRPKANVVDRPHAGAGGHGYSLTGHHELMVPLLAALLAERSA